MTQAIIQTGLIKNGKIFFQEVKDARNAKIVAWEIENIFNVKVVAIFYVKLKPLTLGNLKYF